ncbi:MAG: hypothetical protein H0W70_00125 [Actinobacteria bacterium]|nr:hypothetical protein [Actinomycetota bacterium]
MSALRPGEWDALADQFADATARDGPDGLSLITIPAVKLPPGWSAGATPISFVLPVGYPAAQPDCFWASVDLRLASGAMPSNSGVQQIPHTQTEALWFSWHLASWRPATDNISTYARFVLRRFADAR